MAPRYKSQILLRTPRKMALFFSVLQLHGQSAYPKLTSALATLRLQVTGASRKNGKGRRQSQELLASVILVVASLHSCLELTFITQIEISLYQSSNKTGQDPAGSQVPSFGDQRGYYWQLGCKFVHSTQFYQSPPLLQPGLDFRETPLLSNIFLKVNA